MSGTRNNRAEKFDYRYDTPHNRKAGHAKQDKLNKNRRNRRRSNRQSIQTAETFTRYGIHTIRESSGKLRDYGNGTGRRVSRPMPLSFRPFAEFFAEHQDWVMDLP